MKNFLESVVHLSIYAMPFLVLLVTESLFFPFITGKNFTFRILVEIMFFAWAILALYEVRYRPKFSFIAALLTAFVFVMFFANSFGAYPFKSFWSNFERMEGYVTIVHVLMYFLVLGSSVHALSQKKWLMSLTASFTAILGLFSAINIFGDFPSASLWSFPMGLVTISAVTLFGFLIYTMWRTTDAWSRLFTAMLSVAVLLSWYALAQFFGTIAVSQGSGWRIDGTLGNSTYMAVYMLFHIFIASILFLRSRAMLLRGVYGFLVFTFIFMLVQTGTRGTTLGLIGGVFLSVLYIAVFAKGQRVLRTTAVSICVALMVLGSFFIAFRDSEFVQHDPRLARIASITLEEGKTRFTIWSMAFEGVKERPILGWGQGNYDYVFNKYYMPSLYAQEPWFDRVHNIVLDWLIAGGVIGALCYFGIFVAALWYLLWVPLMRPNEKGLPVVERGLLFGLLGGYMFHNLFVFDNVVSYILFALVLAYLHSVVATPVEKIEKIKLETYKIRNVFAPIAGVLLVAILYMVNVPSMKAAGDIIDAFRVTAPKEQLAAFERALSRDSFSNQEIREQMMQVSLQVIYSPNVPAEIKQQWFVRTGEEIQKQLKEKPGDARGMLLAASFYRATGNFEEAKRTLEAARAVSPHKQQIIFEQGLVGLQEKRYDEALRYFKEAYELAPEFTLARALYAAAGISAGESELFATLIDTEERKIVFAESDIALSVLHEQKEYELLKDMMALRITLHPQNTELRVTLASLYVETGDVSHAIKVLEDAIEAIPAFKAEGEAMIQKLKG